jgi:LysR family glycine cleavage system transcriptional activator
MNGQVEAVSKNAAGELAPDIAKSDETDVHDVPQPPIFEPQKSSLPDNSRKEKQINMVEKPKIFYQSRMTSNLPNLSWLRTFEAVARHRSFTGAGTELGLTQAAVSTQISALETRLGSALFHRTTRRIALTEMGKAYLPPVQKALEELALSTQGLFDTARPGTVTVKAPISTAVMLIAPRLGEFQARHPNIKVRLISEIWTPVAPETNVDIEIRLGAGTSDDKGRVEFLFEDTIVPICAPSLSARLRNPENLIDQPLIHILGHEDHWPAYWAAAELSGGPHVSCTVDTSLAAAEMVAADAGVALILKRGARYLEAGGRVAIVGGIEISYRQQHFIAAPESSKAERAEVQVFKAWLRSALA